MKKMKKICKDISDRIKKDITFKTETKTNLGLLEKQFYFYNGDVKTSLYFNEFTLNEIDVDDQNSYEELIKFSSNIILENNKKN